MFRVSISRNCCEILMKCSFRTCLVIITDKPFPRSRQVDNKVNDIIARYIRWVSPRNFCVKLTYTFRRIDFLNFLKNTFRRNYYLDEYRWSWKRNWTGLRRNWEYSSKFNLSLSFDPRLLLSRWSFILTGNSFSDELKNVATRALLQAFGVRNVALGRDRSLTWRARQRQRVSLRKLCQKLSKSMAKSEHRRCTCALHQMSNSTRERQLVNRSLITKYFYTRVMHRYAKFWYSKAWRSTKTNSRISKCKSTRDDF